MTTLSRSACRRPLAAPAARRSARPGPPGRGVLGPQRHGGGPKPPERHSRTRSGRTSRTDGAGLVVGVGRFRPHSSRRCAAGRRCGTADQRPRLPGPVRFNASRLSPCMRVPVTAAVDDALLVGGDLWVVRALRVGAVHARFGLVRRPVRRGRGLIVVSRPVASGHQNENLRKGQARRWPRRTA